jgi:hypothetical protein
MLNQGPASGNRPASASERLEQALTSLDPREQLLLQRLPSLRPHQTGLVIALIDSGTVGIKIAELSALPRPAPWQSYNYTQALLILERTLGNHGYAERVTKDLERSGSAPGEIRWRATPKLTALLGEQSGS